MQSKQHLAVLPLEVLMEIFTFVPNKKPLKATCVDFYKAVCKMEEKKLRLVVKDVRKSSKHFELLFSFQHTYFVYIGEHQSV